MRGRFPLTIAFSDAGVNGFIPYGNIANGIPSAPSPDLSTGNVPLPRGVDMTTPDPNNSTRGATQSWNVFFERRLPLDIGASIGYVGTRTDGQYSTLNANYAEFGGNGDQAAVRQCRDSDHQYLCEQRQGALQLAPAGSESPLQEWPDDQRGVHAQQGHERG